MSQRTWFITGISSGFGRRMAEILLAGGNRVVGTVRDLDSVKDLQASHGDRLAVYRLDLTEGAQAITTVVDAAFKTAGRIDVVVNNAGYGLFGAVEELTDEQIVHQIETNLLGSIRVTRAAVPYLRTQGGGRIIQVSTYGGQATNPGASVYNAGKWGIEGFMEATALDLAPFGIGVTIVEPGSAGTGFRTGGARLAEPLAAYDGTPAAMVRRIKDPSLPSVGDVDKMVAAMIATVDQPEAPRRLALGSDSYRYMHVALTARLGELESGKETAFSTDLPEAG
ncbi:short-chain dehydrogenase/reductase [Streptomyces sp. Ru62]|uniref:SDR family oxidoreductase n=1 Tax=Streptomyces sp. Ru62 TaxID=2080745 RepID=UPI000CDD7208|nr:SDR family oxidoreductase [Streptomyces sp. Ru62]POX58760.1 short-chain dehydrogenase/reductase [Streptomyces sp. Ru62]